MSPVHLHRTTTTVVVCTRYPEKGRMIECASHVRIWTFLLMFNAIGILYSGMTYLATLKPVCG
jgi:hypothetical protein